MLKRQRLFFIERLRRLKYIQNELAFKVNKSLIYNKYNNCFSACTAKLKNSKNNTKDFYTSKFKIWCPITNSAKKVNSNYRVSRFEFNRLARLNFVSSISKKGW